MEDRERTVGVFVHLNGHFDKMPAMALLRDLQHPSLVAHGDFDLCLVVVGSSPDSLLEKAELERSVPRRRKALLGVAIGDGGTEGEATYRFRSETAMLGSGSL